MLVMKKVMSGDCGSCGGGGCCAWPAIEPSDTKATDATIAMHVCLDIVILPFEPVSRFRCTLVAHLPWNAAGYKQRTSLLRCPRIGRFWHFPDVPAVPTNVRFQG